jgi:hypothetical protein
MALSYFRQKFIIEFEGIVKFKNKFINILYDFLQFLSFKNFITKLIFVEFAQYQFVSYHFFKPKINQTFDINSFLFFLYSVEKISLFKWKAKWKCSEIEHYNDLAIFFYHYIMIAHPKTFQKTITELSEYFKNTQKEKYRNIRKKRKNNEEIKCVKQFKL